MPAIIKGLSPALRAKCCLDKDSKDGTSLEALISFSHTEAFRLSFQESAISMERPAPHDVEEGEYEESDDSDGDFDAPLCRDFQNGRCRRLICRFRHDEPLSKGTTAELQQDFQNSDAKKMPFCHDFQNGACHRSFCRFRHDKLDEEPLATAKRPRLS